MILKAGLHLLIGLTYLAAVLALSEPMQAETILQQQGTLERGDQVIELDGSLADLYTFTGEAGQQIRITLESSEFDAYLILLDPDSNQIADNDDANQSTHNAELVLTLPEDGTYSVIVNGYDRSDRGQYSLTVSSGTASATTTASAITLQDLPDGDYRYYDGPAMSYTHRPGSPLPTQNIILRKQGNIVVGIFFRDPEDESCFRGTVSQNTINNITYGSQDLGAQESDPWMFAPGREPIDLDTFQSRSSSLEGNKRNLEYCIEGMAEQ